MVDLITRSQHDNVGQFAQVVAQVLSLMSNFSLRVPSEFGNSKLQVERFGNSEITS
jgi:hypothetical protein